MQTLPHYLAKLADATDKKDSTRFALANVRVELDPAAGKYTAVATDSKVLVVVEGTSPAPVEGEPCPPDPDTLVYPRPRWADTTPNSGTVAVVPADTWREFFKAAGKVRRTSTLNNVVVAPSEKQVTIGYTDGTEERKVEVAYPDEKMPRFPPHKDIIGQSRKGSNLVTFALDGEQLANLLRTITAIADDGTGSRVEFEVMVPEPGRSQPPILMTTRRAEAEITALIMPLPNG